DLVGCVMGTGILVKFRWGFLSFVVLPFCECVVVLFFILSRYVCTLWVVLWAWEFWLSFVGGFLSFVVCRFVSVLLCCFSF
ncbi:hypothetical protein, partial [Pseudomonas lurida]|uniref:hypothetical protein n=1 Tax=Pseudomonas lurida TaxID=244566 RepID=UPI0034D97375